MLMMKPGPMITISLLHGSALFLFEILIGWSCEHWKSWLTATAHLGWVYCDRWLLNQCIHGLHRSLSKWECCQPDNFSPTHSSHCPFAVDLCATSARTRLTLMATGCATFAVAPVISTRLVNELSMAIFKAHQVAVAIGSDNSNYEVRAANPCCTNRIIGASLLASASSVG